MRSRGWSIHTKVKKKTLQPGPPSTAEIQSAPNLSHTKDSNQIRRFRTRPPCVLLPTTPAVARAINNDTGNCCHIAVRDTPAFVIPLFFYHAYDVPGLLLLCTQQYSNTIDRDAVNAAQQPFCSARCGQPSEQEKRLCTHCRSR